MNISTGIAEINFLKAGKSESSKKIHVWPVYNAGTVLKIDRVSPKTASNINRYNPYIQTNKDHHEVLKNSSFTEYESNGKLNAKKSSCYPGFHFNALA